MAAVPSMNSTDSPAAMLVTPLSAIALANALELSSTFQPARSTACAPRLVTSNQSAPYGLSPLLHGDASVTASLGAIAPGEPVSPLRVNAPLTPATLSLRPLTFSKVKPLVDAPKLTPVTRVPAGLNRFTASPSVERPMPEPL